VKAKAAEAERLRLKAQEE